VALLAPDGAGKSTLAKGIKDSFYFPVRLVYMGIYQKENASATRIHLPGVSFLRRLARQWGRSGMARLYRARGQLVIFDRHTYDELLVPSDHHSWLKRWRRWLLTLGSPKPDLVIFLDAPGDVLYARKGEHSPDFLEQRRQAYLRLLSKLPNLVIIDAVQDADHVRHQAMALIWNAYIAHQINRDPELAKHASTGERLSQHA
jgi:thymidylate kinase